MKQIFIQEELAQGNDVSSLALQRVLSIEQIERETAIMSTLDHPNIVQYIGWGRYARAYLILRLFLRVLISMRLSTSRALRPHSTHLHGIRSRGLAQQVRPLSIQFSFFRLSHTALVIRYDTRGDSLVRLLRDFGPFGEVAIRSYTRQLLCGVAYLHAQRIAHRDLKCANLLLSDDGTLKIADFGTAKRAKDCEEGEWDLPSWQQQQRLETARCALPLAIARWFQLYSLSGWL